MGVDVGAATIDELRTRWESARDVRADEHADVHAALEELRDAIRRVEKEVEHMQEYMHARFEGITNKMNTLV